MTTFARIPARVTAVFTALSCAALAAAKPLPSGIVDLANGHITAQNTLGNLAKHSWTNPHVAGMRFRTTWKDIQPSAAAFDWTGLDEAMRLATVNHKFIGLSTSAGINTPPWVYAAGATKYNLRDGSANSMPVPWEEAFLTQWTSFIRALGARYDSNPALEYVVISGLGQVVETYLAKTPADANALTALGGTSAWVNAAKRIIAAYADAFPTTPFFLTMAYPFPCTNPHTQYDTSYLAQQEVVNWAIATYPRRFGLMNAGLSTRSNTNFFANNVIYTYQAVQPTGFQMLDSNMGDNGARNGGSLAQVLANGARLGGNFIEVYESDVNDPRQQAVLALQGAALQAAAGW